MQQEQEESLQKQAETFRGILRRERALRGWSQADVAERIGSDPKTVGRWERGLTFPSSYMCQQLSELYGKTVQELGLVRAENGSVVEDKVNEKSANGPLSEDTAGPKQDTEDRETGAVGIRQEPGSIGSARSKTGQIYEGNAWRPLLNWKSCWQSFWVVSLLLISMLLITIGVWGPLHRGSTQIATPAPSNPYASKGTLALNDPLTVNTAASWSLTNNDEGQCFFADGTYRIEAIKKGGYMKLCEAFSTYFINFTYEVKMRVVVGDCGGLAFRSNFPLLYYFIICQDGNYRFVRYDRDYPKKRRIITSGISPLIHPGLNNTNVLAVVANGDMFALYINHTLLYRGTDGAYPDGQIGLLAHTCSIVYLDSRPDICSTPVEVEFSDAKVWKM